MGIAFRFSHCESQKTTSPRYSFYLGVKFYNDLNAPVSMSDAIGIQHLVLEQVHITMQREFILSLI